MSEEIIVERRGGVAVVSLNAPARRNALTVEMARHLCDACDEVDADTTIGAVVIRGGGGHFCAGAELDALRWVGEDPAEDQRYQALSDIYRAFLRVGELRSPTIAAVQGAAIGAGLNLALAADLRIVARDATLAAGFLRIGVHPGGGALGTLSRLVGREAAAAIALFGETLDGVRAHEIGLCWTVVDHSRVGEVATEFAKRIAADPELAQVAITSLRTEADTPLPTRVAAGYERGPQMWSLRRRATRVP